MTNVASTLCDSNRGSISGYYSWTISATNFSGIDLMAGGRGEQLLAAQIGAVGSINPWRCPDDRYLEMALGMPLRGASFEAGRDVDGTRFGQYAAPATWLDGQFAEQETPPVQIQPGGVGTGEAFGTAQVNRTLPIGSNGIASGEAFGTHTIRLYLLPGAIASAEAFGTAKVNRTVSPPSIATAEAFGTAQVNRTITTAGIASTVAFGTAKINRTITAGGIASGEAIGSHLVSVGGPQTVTVTAGIASTETFGTPSVRRVLGPSGIPTGEAFGTPQLNLIIGPAGGIGGTSAPAVIYLLRSGRLAIRVASKVYLEI